MWGRAIGVAFAVPLLFFLSRGMISGWLKKRLALLFAMGGAQVCACPVIYVSRDLEQIFFYMSCLCIL